MKGFSKNTGRLSIALFAILFFSSTLHADKLADEAIKKLELPADGNSIYRLHFWTDSAVILTGAAISLGANAFSYEIIKNRCPCDPNSVNIIDRPAIVNENKTIDIIANYTVGLAMVAPIIIDYLDVGLSKSFAEDMVVYSQVLSVNFALITISKFAFQRPYPYMYNKPAGFHTDPSDYQSFYSGHTSTTFATLAAASMTWNLRHKNVQWPWIVTGVMGASIATELVVSGEHFTTDVVVGALMGLAVGTIVPGLHAKDSNWYKHIFFVPSTDQAQVIWKMDI